MKKRLLRTALILSTAVVLLIVCAFLFLHTPQAGRMTLGQARNYLLRSGIDLRASRMDFNLLNQSVTLENAVVRSDSAQDLPPLFRASRIYVRLGILNVIRGLVNLEELRIDAPQIHYFVRQDGTTNVPKRGRSSGPAPDILISRAEVKGGSFRYENLRSKTDLSFPLWQVSVGGERQSLDHHIVFATQQPASLSLKNRTIPIDSMKFLGNLEKKGLRIDSAQVRSSRTLLSVKGSIKDFSDPEIDLQLDPELDLNTIGQILGPRNLRGDLSGKVHLTGKPKDLKIDVHLSGRHLDAGHYKGARFNISTRAEWASGRVLLHSFGLDSPEEGTVRGSGELFPGSTTKTNSLEFSLRSFNLFPVWKFVKAPLDLASRGTGKVSLGWKGPLRASQLSGIAYLDLTATQSLPEKYVLPISGKIDVKMQPGRIVGIMNSFSVLGTQLTGPFTLLNLKTVEADVEGYAGQIDAMMAQIAQFAGDPDPTIIGARMTGPLQFHARAAGELGRPDIVVTADAPDLTVGVFRTLDVKTEATIENWNVAFKSMVQLPQDSAVSAQGSLDFSAPKTYLKLDAQMQNAPPASVLSVLGASVPAEGRLNANLHIDGPVNNLAGTASVIGDQLTIYREPVGHFDMDLRIAGGEIQSEPFRIIRDPQQPEANYIDANFRYRPGSDAFDFEATGKGLTWTNLPGAETVKGTADLVASGTGTFAEPTIDLKLEAKDVRVRQSPVGPVSISAALRHESLTVDAVASRLNTNSTVHIINRSPYPFEGEARISHADLSVLGLKGTNKQPLTGTLAADLKGSGNLTQAADAFFSARIETLDLYAGTLHLQTGSPFEAEYRDGSIDLVTPATIVSGKSRLEMAGSIPFEGATSKGLLTLRGQIDLRQATGFLPAPEGFQAEGMMNLDLSLAGSPRKLSSAGTITMDGGVVRLPRLATPLTDVTIRANLQSGSLVLKQADAMWADGRIALSGELPFGMLPKDLPVHFPRKEGPVRFDLDVANFRPEITGMLPRKSTGLVSVYASGHIASTDLHTLNAEIVFRDFSFKANEIGLAQDGPSTILVKDGVASI